MESLLDVMKQRDRKTILSDLYDSHDLHFSTNQDTRVLCADCREGPIRYARELYIDDDGERSYIPRYTTTMRMLFIDERLICEDCFIKRYYNRPIPRKVDVGVRHGSIPGSQRQYDGDNFYSGEW